MTDDDEIKIDANYATVADLFAAAAYSLKKGDAEKGRQMMGNPASEVTIEPRNCNISRRSKSSLRTPSFDSPAGCAAVQQANPDWLIIGATTHWSAMASFHREGLGCAQCLHPDDDPGVAPIPATACVSFWAGLLAASYIARHAANQAISPREQQVFLTPFRPESPFR
jgi:hypothetical protein